MHCGYKKKKEKSFIRGKELSSANSLNLTQMSQLSQQTWQGAATTTHFTCQQRVYRHLRGDDVFTGEWHTVVETTLQGNQTICGSYPLLGCVVNHDTSPAPHSQWNCCLWFPTWHPTFISMKVTCQDLMKSLQLQSTQDGVINKQREGDAAQDHSEQVGKFALSYNCNKTFFFLYLSLGEYLILIGCSLSLNFWLWMPSL